MAPRYEQEQGGAAAPPGNAPTARLRASEDTDGAVSRSKQFGYLILYVDVRLVDNPVRITANSVIQRVPRAMRLQYHSVTVTVTVTVTATATATIAS
jgi:hypothetical protein